MLATLRFVENKAWFAQAENREKYLGEKGELVYLMGRTYLVSDARIISSVVNLHGEEAVVRVYLDIPEITERELINDELSQVWYNSSSKELNDYGLI